MKVYFAGTNRPQLEMSGAWAATSSASIISPFVSCGIQAVSIGVATEAAVGEFTEPSSNFWFSFYVAADTGSSPSSDTIVSFHGASGEALIRFYRDGSRKFVLEYFNGTSWVQVGEYVSYSSRLKVDLQVVLDATSGHLEWFVNETSQASYTGNTLFTATDSITGFKLFRLATSTSDNGRSAFSGIMCLDVTTIGRQLTERRPSGVGAHSDWEGSYDDLSPINFNPLTRITGEPGQRVTYAKTALSGTSGYVVDAVVFSVNARHENMAAAKLSPTVFYGGTAYDLDPQDLEMSYKLLTYVAEINPSTSLPWSVADLNTSQMGLVALLSE